MAKFTKLPTNAFQKLQINAAMLLRTFNPAEAVPPKDEDIIGATSGGINFAETTTFKDFGDDIDNCPKNSWQLKRIESREAKVSGSFVTMDTAEAKSLLAAADIDKSDTTKVTPRNDLHEEDFDDIWIVGDYSEYNGNKNGGFVAIHLMKALSTGGFQLQTTEKEKGKYSFEYTAHYSLTEQDVVPYEIYIKAGSAEV